jgi:hypothetical protein
LQKQGEKRTKTLFLIAIPYILQINTKSKSFNFSAENILKIETKNSIFERLKRTENIFEQWKSFI